MSRPRRPGSLCSKRAALIAGLAALIIGCSGPSSSSSSSSASSPSETEGSVAILCPGVTTLGPDGSRVDLTGTWRGFPSTGFLFVTQTQSCVAIEGLSNYPDQPLGAQWRIVFVGDLTDEFTVAGRWTWTRWVVNPDVTTGDTFAISMPIDFDDQNQPVIQIAPMDVIPDPTAPRQMVTLERISSSTAYPD